MFCCFCRWSWFSPCSDTYYITWDSLKNHYNHWLEALIAAFTELVLHRKPWGSECQHSQVCWLIRTLRLQKWRRERWQGKYNYKPFTPPTLSKFKKTAKRPQLWTVSGQWSGGPRLGCTSQHKKSFDIFRYWFSTWHWQQTLGRNKLTHSLTFQRSVGQKKMIFLCLHSLKKIISFFPF